MGTTTLSVTVSLSALTTALPAVRQCTRSAERRKKLRYFGKLPEFWVLQPAPIVQLFRPCRFVVAIKKTAYIVASHSMLSCIITVVYHWLCWANLFRIYFVYTIAMAHTYGHYVRRHRFLYSTTIISPEEGAAWVITPEEGATWCISDAQLLVTKRAPLELLRQKRAPLDVSETHRLWWPVWIIETGHRLEKSHMLNVAAL